MAVWKSHSADRGELLLTLVGRAAMRFRLAQ
jgi:hypothetical protein